MKTLNKYLIPELTSIVLDYYYHNVENMNKLNIEYHNRASYDDYDNLILRPSFKLYNYRWPEYYPQEYYDINNIYGYYVGVLPNNYL